MLFSEGMASPPHYPSTRALAVSRIKIKFCMLLDLQLLLAKKLFSICDVINMNFENFDQSSIIGSSKFAREKTRSEQQFGSC